MSTVLVGNGESAIGLGIGAAIDSCSRVVRFNNFKLAGFEKDLGRRTTDHVRHVGINGPLMNGGVESWWVSRPRDIMGLFLDPYVPSTHIVPASIVQQAQDDAGLDGDLKYCSSGLMALYHALSFERQVVLVNFDHARTGHYWSEGHKHCGCHDWEAEARLMNKLESEGRVIRWT